MEAATPEVAVASHITKFDWILEFWKNFNQTYILDII
jgi:hypothetical protein